MIALQGSYGFLEGYWHSLWNNRHLLPSSLLKILQMSIIGFWKAWLDSGAPRSIKIWIPKAPISWRFLGSSRHRKVVAFQILAVLAGFWIQQFQNLQTSERNLQYFCCKTCPRQWGIPCLTRYCLQFLPFHSCRKTGRKRRRWRGDRVIKW